MNREKLAIKGGSPVRKKPFPEWPVHGEIERNGLLEVLESGEWSGIGPKEREFAQAFAAFTGARHGICAANGSITLELALRALKVGPGDEVIVPALTWLATAWAALQVGAKPVFADIRGEDWCLDPDSVREKLTPRTRAIIPVHLYNQMAPMEELMNIASERGLHVVEDCAHAHGMRGAGTVGDIGSFSFQLSKTMTAGEGGMLVTNNDRLAERLAGLRNCGRPLHAERAATFGSNYRITEFQAAVLLGQLARLPEQLARKQENVSFFRQRMRDVEGVVLTPEDDRAHGFYAVSMSYDPNAFGGMPREVFVEAMGAEGIPVSVPYETVYEAYLWKGGEKIVSSASGENVRELLGLESQCPVSERVSRVTGIKLLHHCFLGDREDVDQIVEAFQKVHRNAGQLRLRSLKTKARRHAGSVLRALRSGAD